MSKKAIYALVLIAILVILFILNAGQGTSVNLRFAEIRAVKALIFLFFTTIGVVIGVLLK